MLSEQLTENADWELRHTLQNEPRLMLLATAVSRFEAIANMGKAWFDLFAIHELEPLGQEQCVELWRSVSGGELDAGRSRAVRILTGGNPRLLTILAEFAARKSFRELMEQLVQLIDSHTEYFKNHLETLGVLERKVFVVVLESWDAIPARDVAQAARMGTNKASALLQRLAARGAVEAVPQNGRRKLYQAAERLYNVYYLMRRRGHPSSRVKAVVVFMVYFYEGQDLVETAADLAREACSLSPGQRRDHYLAYDEIVRHVPQDLRLEIVKATPDPFFDPKLTSYEPEERPRPMDFRAGDAALEGADSIDDEHLESSNSSLSPQAWVLRGVSLAEKGDVAEAEQAFRKATKVGPRYTPAWAHLGELLHTKLERHEEAEAAYRRALDLNPKVAPGWAMLGQLLHEKLERYEEAEESYRKALELDPEVAWTWAKLGQLLHEKLERYEEAEKSYRKAVEVDPKYLRAWVRLGLLLHEKLERYEEAEAAYRKAVEVDPKYAWAWGQLGLLLHEKLERYEEAEEAYRRAEELAGPGSCFGLLAKLRLDRGEDFNSVLRQAETSLREALVASDGSWELLYRLVTLLRLQGKWEEALKESVPLLDAASAQEDAVGTASDFLIEAASASHAKEALRTVTNSAGASALEPLIVGLRLFLGEKPRVAKEILEVGQDVAERIRARQLQRSQQEQEAAEDPVTDLPGKQPVRRQQLPG